MQHCRSKAPNASQVPPQAAKLSHLSNASIYEAGSLRREQGGAISAEMGSLGRGYYQVQGKAYGGP